MQYIRDVTLCINMIIQLNHLEPTLSYMYILKYCNCYDNNFDLLYITWGINIILDFHCYTCLLMASHENPFKCHER